jgi:adenylate kinase
MTGLIILLGPTGAGKSTQGEYLANRHDGWLHLSSGDLLRADPKIAASLTSGRLATSDEVDRVVDQALAAHHNFKMIVLDGFPRTMEQVPWLMAACKRYGLELRAVMHLDITQEEAVKRLIERGRPDDNAQSIAAKWQWYHAQTLPLLAHYQEQGLAITLDGTDSVEKVGRAIEQALHV